MYIKNRKLIAAAGLSLLLASGQLAGAVLLHDAFSGTTLDLDKWNPGGHSSQNHSVSDGALTLTNSGSNHRSSVHTKDQFNFHQSTYTFTVDVVSFDRVPGISGFDNQWFSLAVGPAIDRLDRVPQNGFNFGFRWRADYADGSQRLELLTENSEGDTGISGARISGIPSQIEFTLDPTSFSISMMGATFLDGDFEGLSTMTGMHDLPGYDNYHLMLLHTMGGNPGASSVVIDSVTVIPEPSTYAAILGLLVSGVLLYRRRRR